MKTTIYSVLCIAIRIGAVLMAVNVVEQVPNIFYYARHGSYATAALWFSGAELILAFALWLSPNLLAR